ncbi:hypothetical protein N7450_011800 [Penicillium hetheringtonii]|uniref:Uncharacterized protein n=1 Tax=Penicillium hetheringtonii TaxID=911720 RepID=A0AAD6GP04_9EURO|nr:hypothetical protein N7450_011800 [Penicillium hetheringtonii]
MLSDDILPLIHTRTPSATFPLTHSRDDVDEPFADVPRITRAQHSTQSTDTPTPVSTPGNAPEPASARPRSHAHSHFRSHSHTHSHSRSHSHDPLGLDGPRYPHFSRHKHSKSRELRLPKPMSQLTSAGARGFWSRERDREDDGMLRPITRETTRSRWGSESTRGTGGTNSRRGSLLDVPGQHERLGPIRRQEIQSMEDLERVKRRRKQGEEYLRSALTTISTQATDATRRLDYTYYSLLEKITALNSTISSFQELSDSAAAFLSDFERETSTLDQDLRKQIIDLKGFTPQTDKISHLESRMQSGRAKAELLGSRLEGVKKEIEQWERREMEWQEKTSRRLRIFWIIAGSTFLVLILGIVLQSSTQLNSMPAGPESKSNPQSDSAMNQSFSPPASLSASLSASWYPSSLAERRESLRSATTSSITAKTTDDPLRVLNEL